MAAQAEKEGFVPLTKKRSSFAEAAGRELYPAIEPYESGMLEVGDGHALYWELSGNAASTATAVFLHGGPGGGCGVHTRRFFDPKRYRILTFDQRGCNRSTPNAADDWAASIHCNDTPHLIADIEKLREHVGVATWAVVLGGSWGSTLGVAYAQAHPDRLRALVLRGIFLFMPDEVDNLFQNGAQAMNHPEAWEGYENHIRTTPGDWEVERTNLLAAYYRRLRSDDAAVREGAAKAFVSYELSVSTTFPNTEKADRVLSTPEILVPFALFEAHYMLNNGFLRRGQLLDDVDKIAHVPTTIVHGRCDFVCRPVAAWRLARALRVSRAADDVALEIVDGAGHSDTEPGIVDALVRATDALRT